MLGLAALGVPLVPFVLLILKAVWGFIAGDRDGEYGKRCRGWREGRSSSRGWFYTERQAARTGKKAG